MPVLYELTTWSTEIQYGFAGFAFVLLSCLMGIVTWAFKKVIEVIKENNRVISDNNRLIDRIRSGVADNKGILVTISSALASRPCLYYLDEVLRTRLLAAIKRHEEEEQSRIDEELESVNTSRKKTPKEIIREASKP